MSDSDIPRDEYDEIIFSMRWDYTQDRIQSVEDLGFDKEFLKVKNNTIQKVFEKESFDVFEIDKSKFTNTHFYKSPYMTNCIYTFDAIPPHAISLLYNDISYNEFMRIGVNYDKNLHYGYSRMRKVNHFL